MMKSRHFMDRVQRVSKVLTSAALVTFALFALSLGGMAQTVSAHTLRFMYVPAKAGVLCDDYAAQLARNLTTYLGQSVPGFKVSRGYCPSAEIDPPSTSTSLLHWTVRIEYESVAPLELVTTVGNTLERPGYKTRAECEAAINSETPLFERATGLKVFVGYCRTPSVVNLPWELNLSALGTPKLKPYMVSTSIEGPILNHTLQSFTELVRAGLARNGHEMAHLSITSHTAYSTVGVRYYGKSLFQMRSSSLGRFPSFAMCLDMVPKLDKALADASVPNLGSICFKEHTKPEEGQLIALTNADERLEIVEIQRNYEKIEACQQDIEGTISYYRQNLGRDIKFGYCSLAPRVGFQINLIEKI
jgi:hypothetical protein